MAYTTTRLIEDINSMKQSAQTLFREKMITLQGFDALILGYNAWIEIIERESQNASTSESALPVSDVVLSEAEFCTAENHEECRHWHERKDGCTECPYSWLQN